MEEKEIPETWILEEIGNIGILTSGQHIMQRDYNESGEGIPYLTGPSDFGPTYPTHSKWTTTPKAKSGLNEILITVKGSGVGKINMLNFEAAISRQLMGLKVFCNNWYVYYFWLSQFRKLQGLSTGTAIPGISRDDILGFPIPLPPLLEQQRITEKIEELFSDLDNGVNNLKLVQKQLEAYRQSLLKYAFEGKLTEEWRKENNPEHADKLLERIKEEGQKRYVEELADWKLAVTEWENRKKKGKKPRKPPAPVVFPKLTEYDLMSLPNIPNSWKWVRNNELLHYVTSGSRGWKKYYSEKGAYFIRTQDIKTNQLQIEKAAYVDLPENVEGKRSLVKKGDLLMTITGANVGKVAFIKESIPEAYVSQSVALMKPISDRITPFLHLYFQSEVYGAKMIKELVYGVGRPVLSLENMREAPVALCSFEEQEQIISEVELQFSIIDNLEKTIEKSFVQSEILRQSILKKAFEGKLVPQDPNEAPAKELQRHIKEEKKRYLAEQKRQKKKKPKKTKRMKKELSIKEVLKANGKAMPAKKVWQQSKHKDNIEEFYAELKKIQQNIKEVKKGTESLLSFIE